MNVPTAAPRFDRGSFLRATLVFAASMLLYTAILRVQQRGPDAAVPAAAVLALGTLGSAAALWRNSVMPQWARFASAGVVAVAIVVCAILVPESITSRHATPWLMPWTLLLMGSTVSSRRSAACASPDRIGRTVFILSAILGLLSVGAALLGHPL